MTRYTHGVAQALRLMNSASVVRGDGPVVKRITAKGLPKAEALELAYLATLARRPTPEEVKRWDEFTAGAKDLTTDGRSVLWVLLNSAEFAFNH